MIEQPQNPTLPIHGVIHSMVYYGRKLVWSTNKNFLKMCGEKNNSEYLYIK